MSTPLTLDESSRLLGHYRHAELVGYASLAPRVVRARTGVARGFLLRAASSHAYRAGALEALLPVSATLPDASELTVALDDRIDRAFARCVEAPDAALRAALVEVVYPALEASYRAHLARCSPFSDPPVALVLGRLLGELAAVRSEGVLVKDDETDGGSDDATASLLADLEDLLGAGLRVDSDHF